MQNNEARGRNGARQGTRDEGERATRSVRGDPAICSNNEETVGAEDGDDDDDDGLRAVERRDVGGLLLLFHRESSVKPEWAPEPLNEMHPPFSFG